MEYKNFACSFRMFERPCLPHRDVNVNSLDPRRDCTLQVELIVTTSLERLGNPQFHNASRVDSCAKFTKDVPNGSAIHLKGHSPSRADRYHSYCLYSDISSAWRLLKGTSSAPKRVRPEPAYHEACSGRTALSRTG